MQYLYFITREVKCDSILVFEKSLYLKLLGIFARRNDLNIDFPKKGSTNKHFQIVAKKNGSRI